MRTSFLKQDRSARGSTVPIPRKRPPLQDSRAVYICGGGGPYNLRRGIVRRCFRAAPAPLAEPHGVIVAASYRTDIPAFYAHWLRRRREAGRCAVANPYGSGNYEVSLRAGEVEGFVFWTRNIAPL